MTDTEGTDDRRKVLAARIRRGAEREYKRCDDGVQSDRPLEALLLLKHIRPGQVESAIWSHGVLIREAIRQLREIGLVDQWSDLINETHAFIEMHELEYRAGRWITHAEEEAEFRARFPQPVVVS